MDTQLSPYALAISVVSLVVSLAALLYTRRNARATAEQRLTERESKVNEAFVNFKVRSPLANRLNIPDSREPQFTAKAVLLLHQINLYREAFEHRDLVSKERFSAYRSWAQSILRPWIESDDDLRRTFALIIESENTHDRDFISELRSLKVTYPPREA
jgi:hypothetical protein